MLCLSTSAKLCTFEALDIDGVDVSMTGVRIRGVTGTSADSLLCLRASAKHARCEALGIDGGQLGGVTGTSAASVLCLSISEKDCAFEAPGIDDVDGLMAFLNGFVAMDRF